HRVLILNPSWIQPLCQRSNKMMTKPRYVFDETERKAMEKYDISLNDYRNRRRAGWNRDCAIYLDKYQDPNELASIIDTKDLRSILESAPTGDTARLKVHPGWRYEDAISTHKRDREMASYPAQQNRIVL